MWLLQPETVKLCQFLPNIFHISGIIHYGPIDLMRHITFHWHFYWYTTEFKNIAPLVVGQKVSTIIIFIIRCDFFRETAIELLKMFPGTETSVTQICCRCAASMCEVDSLHELVSNFITISKLLVCLCNTSTSWRVLQDCKLLNSEVYPVRN